MLESIDILFGFVVLDDPEQGGVWDVLDHLEEDEGSETVVEELAFILEVLLEGHGDVGEEDGFGLHVEEEVSESVEPILGFLDLLHLVQPEDLEEVEVAHLADGLVDESLVDVPHQLVMHAQQQLLRFEVIVLFQYMSEYFLELIGLNNLYGVRGEVIYLVI